MKRKNRWKAIVLTVIFVLTATACADGKKSGETIETAGLPETTAPADETKTSSGELLMAAPAAVSEEENNEIENPGPGVGEDTRELSGAEAFAERIQEAVADKDMEVLADLLSYPCRIVIPEEEELVLNSREEFMKLNPDRVFGDDLMVAAATVDTGDLVPENGQVFMGDGETGITFSVSENGTMGIELIHQ